MTLIGTVVYLAGIAGLFILERERGAKTSRALWIPIIWLMINASRPVSEWLQMGSPSAIDESVEGSPLDRNFFFLLIALGAYFLFQRQQKVIRFLRSNPWIVVFVIYCALSVVWSDYADVALKRWIKSLGDFIMVLIVLTEAQRLNAIKRLFSTTSFILMPLSVMLIKYYPDMSRYYSPWEGTMYVSGVSVDKNMLGMTCLVCGLATLWRVLEVWQNEKGKKRTLRLMAHGTVLGMTLWLFWMANSMTSLSCFLMAGSLMTVTTLVPMARKRTVVHLLVLGVVCVSASTLFLNFGGGALETMGRNSTLTGRTEIWKGLLQISDSPLLGAGFESFWVGDRLRMIWGMNGYLYGVNEAHNAYLQVFLNLGWIGVGMLIGIIFKGYRNVIAVLREDRTVGGLALGFFVAAIIYGFTEASAFGMMSPIWIAFLLATLTIPAPAKLEEGPADAPAAEMFRGARVDPVGMSV
jgi:O-antigen ligase